MKIALVSADVLPTPPVNYGGLERVVYDLARHLALKGHQVSLYAIEGSRAPEGVELVEIEHSSDLLTPEGEHDVLSNHEVIHCHDWSLVGWQLAQRHPERPFFQTWHGPYLGSRAHWQAPPENLLLCGISEWHAQLLRAELGCERIFAIHNGVEVADFPLYEGPREPYLAYLNRLGSEKGLHVAIHLMRSHPSRHFHLRVAGTERHVGDHEFVLEMLKRMDGVEVVYEGDLGLEPKYELLSKAWALLWLPIGFEEPFGLGIIEAQLTGTPVIALDRGDIRELINEKTIINGIDQGDLGHALTMTNYTPPAVRRHFVATRFSAEAMAERYLDFYQRGLGALGHGDAGGGRPAVVEGVGEAAERFPRLEALRGGLASELGQVVEVAEKAVEEGGVVEK